MELKTWTRKANALKAVEKAVMALDDKLLDNAYVTGYDAADIGNGVQEAWAVKVTTEARPKAVAEMQAKLGTIAEVITTYGGNEEPAEPEQPKAKRKSPGASPKGRFKGMKISIVGGKQAVNPFREGSKSRAAFEFIQQNPGTKFEELKEAGVRMRSVTEMLRDGPKSYNGIARATK